MGEELEAENVLDAHLFRGAAGPGVDVVGEPGESGGLGTDLGGLHDTFGEETVECAVGLGANDEVADLLVADDAEGAEEDPEGDVGLHAGHGCAQEMDLGILGVVHDLDGVGLGHLVIVGADGLHFNHFDVLCGIAIVAEDDGAIGGHALLGDDDALTAADDKVAAVVLCTLAEGDGLEMLLVVEEAVLGADHHGDFAEMDVGEEALTSLTNAAAGIVDEGGLDADVHEQRGSVGEIAHAGVIGHHGENRAVVLKDGGLAEGDVLETERDLVFTGGGGRGGDLGRAPHESIGGGCGETGGGGESGAGARQRGFRTTAHNQRIHLLNDFRDVNIHEMIEGLQLVGDDLSPL